MHLLILGDPGTLPDAIVKRVTDAGGRAHAASPRTDSEAKAVLTENGWTAVVVVTHDDARALRLTLLCAHVRPGLPLWTTLFDRTIVGQLHSIVPSVGILSPADLAADALLACCLESGAGSVSRRRRGVRLVDDALRLLTAAGAGLVLVLIVEVVLALEALHERLADAIFSSARVVATITDSQAAAHGPDWFKLVSTVTALAAVLLVAVFTAALVRRLSRPRLTALVGRRAAPGRRHVVMVGLGQVGFRLAQRLIERSVPVLAVERDIAAPCVRMARRAGIPVAIADAEDRQTLELAGVPRAAVIAAVTSDDLVNVAIGLAAAQVAPAVPLVLRLGDGDVAAETDSLLHLGMICDVHDVVAAAVARDVLGAADRTATA
ncbi:MAG TPA: NAD-binding protein [Solirubrobacteraceae bacterium]|nr:NAD-binding protein [Solirubrobacteraceae bacterium]